jgi:hypothetical protein
MSDATVQGQGFLHRESERKRELQILKDCKGFSQNFGKYG